jgi:adenine deaminase
LLAPGYRADIAVLDDLSGFKVRLVIKDGRLVAREGRLIEPVAGFAPPAKALKTVKLTHDCQDQISNFLLFPVICL